MPKRSSTLFAIIPFTILLVVLAFRLLPRYEIRTSQEWVYRIDRWTGKVFQWEGSKWIELKKLPGLFDDVLQDKSH